MRYELDTIFFIVDRDTPEEFRAASAQGTQLD